MNSHLEAWMNPLVVPRFQCAYLQYCKIMDGWFLFGTVTIYKYRVLLIPAVATMILLFVWY